MYKENKSRVKRPFWHWIGLGLFALLVSAVVIVGATTEEDPRSKLLMADTDIMSSDPTMESDSISYKMKQLFDSFTTDEIKPSEFKYLTKIKEDKALILVQIPKLRKVEKEGRAQAMEIIEMIIENQKDLEGKDLYIGVKGLISMMLIKTPTYEKNSRMALTSNLYEFYGPKPEKVE